MSELEYKDITVEAINDTGIMYDGSWQNVEGKALDYLKSITKDETIKIGIDNNKIKWIKKLDINSKPKSEEKSNFNYNESKQEVIVAQNTLGRAVELAIADNNPSLSNVKAIHKDLYKYIMNGEYKK